MNTTSNSIQRTIHNLWPTMMRIFGALMMGLLLVVGAILILIWSQNQPLSGGVTVSGEIVANETREWENTGDDTRPGQEPANRISYAAIVSYTVDGETYEVAGTSLNSEPFSIGELVDVSYQPANPADGRVINESKAPLFVGIGLIAAIPLVAVVFLWLLPKLANKRDRSGLQPR